MPEPAAVEALSSTDLAALMAPLGPFERRPRLAVAVSGGPDSMALALLAAPWAHARGGELTGLTVDHGLRAGSRGEAQQTGRWLAARGIGHALLTWTGCKPTSGIQAAARAARYALLEAWCRERGVLHLLLAHHLDDQAETVVLRQRRGSGPDGLAAMAAIREVAGLRLLRPLLAVPKERLVATLIGGGQAWLDDPTNRAGRFARGQLRRGARLDRAHAVGLADACGADRACRDRRLAAWLAAHATIDPAGFVRLDRGALATAPDEVAERVLQRVLMTIGDGRHPPRRERLLRLLDWLRSGPTSAGRTLAGCRVLPRGGQLLICREPGAVDPARPPGTHRWQRWDRFLVRCRGRRAGLRVGALGPEGWRQRRQLPGGADHGSVPAAVRSSLPTLWRDGRLLAVPHLGLHGGSSEAVMEVRFEPARSLAGAPFARSRGDGLPVSAPDAVRSLLHQVDSLC